MDKNKTGINSSNNTDSGITARIFQAILKFLQEDNGVFTVMTSNDVSQLPPELTRSGRLDAHWFFDFPSEESRREIFNIYAGKYKYKISPEIINFAIKHTENYTGAEIKEVVKNFARKVFLNLQQNKKFKATTDLMEESIREVTPVYETYRERVNALRTWVKGRARYTEERPADDGEQQFDPFANSPLNF